MKKVKDFIIRKIDDEYIMIPTGQTTEEFNGIISLTETAAFIYNHIEEVTSFDSLIELIIAEYDIDKKTAAEDAYIFINQLLYNRMIELTSKEENW